MQRWSLSPSTVPYRPSTSGWLYELLPGSRLWRMSICSCPDDKIAGSVRALSTKSKGVGRGVASATSGRSFSASHRALMQRCCSTDAPVHGFPGKQHGKRKPSVTQRQHGSYHCEWSGMIRFTAFLLQQEGHSCCQNRGPSQLQEVVQHTNAIEIHDLSVFENRRAL